MHDDDDDDDDDKRHRDTNEQLYSSTSDREKIYTINTNVQSICKLSSGHWCVTYDINCK